MKAATAKVEVTGSFEPLLKRFSDKTERGILRGTLRRTSQQVTLKKARANLKAAGGRSMAKDLTVKTTVSNRLAQAATGPKKKSRLAKVGHLIEGGTKAHSVIPKRARVMAGKGGIFFGTRARHPGTKAKPWLNPALEDNKPQTFGRFGELLNQEIDKAVAKGKR